MAAGPANFRSKLFGRTRREGGGRIGKSRASLCLNSLEGRAVIEERSIKFEEDLSNRWKRKLLEEHLPGTRVINVTNRAHN